MESKKLTSLPPDPDLSEWFAEFRRLAAEAEARFDAGDLRPALASLAAVPMVHRTLMERCGALTEDRGGQEPDEGAHGLYL